VLDTRRLYLTLFPLKPKLVLVAFENSVLTLKKTQPITIRAINQLMLFREVIAVYFENRMKPTNTLCGENAELVIVKAGGTYISQQTLKG
jgi:hypothetical protein